MATADQARSWWPAPSRATLILGSASSGALLGFVLAVIVALRFLGFELPDADGLATVALVGAGWGWALGALFGDLASSGAEPISAYMGQVLRVAATLAVCVGAALLAAEGWLVGTGIRAAELPWIRVVTAADIIAGAATLLTASRAHVPVPGHGVPASVRWLAGAGIIVAAFVSGLLIFTVARAALASLR